ncbi:alpha/beta hydrolase [Algibacter amylolyticus]|uniref:Alpha/beta hydrolase n=1 Tax=Algibacter amylolyticus TaxID=1608400 RepID=A0A5M7BD01_9FLAO|nr:alpha/beta fold hydrolase [Algibacter amylolyticus]KAA5827533.1 alpha/beta hydrolase [Algibacter amylolyticus]MBB5266736.1 dipeptidyl aminopeptidase/acylaminoacyl peptidase [Algibacter amylolyticus]TSJ81778.1 alpha/beta hydrolase [Algibacter amylolyticus]
MIITKNSIISGKHEKPILTDVFYNQDHGQKPVVIFCHGYKGFKDWGPWDLMAEAFANAGFFFIKFNFSYNGGTVEQPIDFPDLEAFGNNNYIKELDDLESVIDWISNHTKYQPEINTGNISLIGHSRAGGIVTIKAEEDNRIKKVISLAGVCDFGKRTFTIGNLEEWKRDGVKYVLNGRTKQQMPHFYQFYENFVANEERLTIKRAVSNLKIPYLIIHGDADTSVLIDEAYNLNNWNSNSLLEIIESANHVFGGSHPWSKDNLPKALKEALIISIQFLNN